MKKVQCSLLWMMILGVLLGWQGKAFALEGAGSGKYATVDIAKVFDEYQKTKENDKVLQSAGKQKETERDGLVREIRQMKDELSLVAEEVREKKQGNLENKVRQLQDFDQKAKEELGDRRATVVKEIFKDIDGTIKRYGERQGIDLVFNEKVLLYYNPKFDVTAAVLKELNDSYSKKK